MQTNKRSARDVQEPTLTSPENSSDAASEINSRKHTRSIFEWLDGIAADKDVPSSAFRSAYVIAQHLNKKTGEAFPSTETIASESGMASSTVRAMITELTDTGHLAVQFGRRGRGHPNRYRPIRKARTVAVLESRKERTVAVLDDGAKGRFERLKPRSDDIKPRRSAMNHLLTTGTTKRAASPPALLDRVVEEAKRERAFAALLAAYPKCPMDCSDISCRGVFDQLLDTGFDPDDLIAGANAYAVRCRNTGTKNIKLLIYWLRVEGWLEQNHHQLDRVH